MGTHPIFESDFDCLTDVSHRSNQICHHEKERLKKLKRLSSSAQRSLREKTSLESLTSLPLSMTPSSISLICQERKQWSVSLEVWRSRPIVMSHLHTPLCW